MPAWQSSRRTVSTFANIRTKAVASAKYSRSLYPALHKAFAPDQHHLNETVKAITGKVMKRAANDLADVIWSVAQGTGAQPQVGSLKVSVRWVGVKSGYPTQWVYVTAKDVDGNPIEGLMVTVAWPTTDGHPRRSCCTPTRTATRCARARSGPRPSSRRSTSSRRQPSAARSRRRTRGGRSRPCSRTGGAGFKTRVSDDDRRARPDGRRHVDRPRSQRPPGPQPARRGGSGTSTAGR